MTALAAAAAEAAPGAEVAAVHGPDNSPIVPPKVAAVAETIAAAIARLADAASSGTAAATAAAAEAATLVGDAASAAADASVGARGESVQPRAGAGGKSWSGSAVTPDGKTMTWKLIAPEDQDDEV